LSPFGRHCRQSGCASAAVAGVIPIGAVTCWPRTQLPTCRYRSKVPTGEDDEKAARRRLPALSTLDIRIHWPLLEKNIQMAVYVSQSWAGRFSLSPARTSLGNARLLRTNYLGTHAATVGLGPRQHHTARLVFRTTIKLYSGLRTTCYVVPVKIRYSGQS